MNDRLFNLLRNSFEDLFYNSKDKKNFFSFYWENVGEILSLRWYATKNERIDIKLPRKTHRFLVEHGDNLPKHRFFAPKMPLSFSSPRVTDFVLSSRYKVGRSTKMQFPCEIWNNAKNLVTYNYTNRTSFMVTRKNEADRVKLSNLTMTHSYYVLPSVEDGESNSVRRLLLKQLLSTGIPLQVFSDLFSYVLWIWRCFCIIEKW